MGGSNAHGHTMDKVDLHPSHSRCEVSACYPANTSAARAGNLTKPWVRQPNEDYTSDLGVSQEQVLNLLDRDVFATADDDVLASPGNADEPHSVHHRPIAGHEPAIWCEVLLGKAPTLHIADE